MTSGPVKLSWIRESSPLIWGVELFTQHQPADEQPDQTLPKASKHEADRLVFAPYDLLPSPVRHSSSPSAPAHSGGRTGETNPASI